MGCDIHCYAEKKIDGDFVQVQMPPHWFHVRSYALFGFLANVRNYSAVGQLGDARRGIPKDVSDDVADEWKTWECDAHSASWYSLSEMLAFDYDKMTEDRRVMRDNNGGCTCEPGEGKAMTYREFLGDNYFAWLKKAEMLGVERIVFWFDN